ncbi:hypothetical protein [Streptomyces peucetius]|uniref:Uncharacterized protein n=1 Tax=Streptomyces peucetius TaxID=1950 RepID=A0ABY6IHS2_STRPE|nr:hypothetical protein [Streptomyces peucetius]UYQ65245.1 hypothetical protein OGH68_29790 [Streptomyces peucetius]
MSQAFVERYEEIQRSAGRTRSVSPQQMLAAWRGFVSSCGEGYEESLAQYFYDVRIRDAIELALTDPGLSALDGYTRFRAAVHEVDDRFRLVATQTLPIRDPERYPWWHRLVPGRAGEELAQQLREEFGLRVDVVQDGG